MAQAEQLDSKTAGFVLGFLHGNHSEQNIERVALFMRDKLRVGGVRQTRAWIREAIAMGAR